FTAGTITAATFTGALNGNALTATTAATASNLAGGLANQMVYQSAANTTAFVGAPGANMVLYGNNGAPVWSNTPAFAGTNITGLPWSGVLKACSTLADLATRSAADLDSGILPLARLSGITNAEISAAAAIADTKLATIAAAGKVSNTATTATHLNAAGAIVARDASGNFTAGTITAALAGNAATATTATLAGSLAGGDTGNIVYQSASNVSAMLGVGAANSLLQTNGAGLAPSWTSAPTITGTNITGIPAANIGAGDLGQNVVASSIAVNAVYPAAVSSGTYAVSITGNANTASNLNGGSTYQMPYQSAANVTSFVAAPGSNMVLYGNSGAPQWTNTPAFTGTNVTSIPWANVLKTASSLADLATRSAADLTSGTLPLARLSGITNAEISAAAAIADTKLATIATAGKVSNTATTAANLNTAGAIVARDASGNFTAGTITAALSGNATTATTAAMASNLAGGAAGNLVYQSAANTSAMLPAGSAYYLLQGNGAGAAPTWTNAPSILGANVTGIPAANIAAGNLGPNVVASSIAVNAVYPGAVTAGTYGVSITGNAAYASNSSKLYSTDPAYAYGAATPFYGYLTYTGTRWRFKVSPSAPEAVEVAYADAAGNADTTDGLHAAAGVNDQPNQLVRTDANGYLKAGWIDTASGANVAQGITRVYASDDSYIRYYTLANFMTQAKSAASGTWTIDISGNAATATRANNINNGLANQVVYQSGPGVTAFVTAPGVNSVLFSNAGTPQWTNTPALTGTNISGLPWSGVLKVGSSLANLETRSAADLDSGILPLARMSGITNAEIAAAAGIVDSKLATISASGKVSNTATTATNLNTASAIVARDANGSFTAGTITAALAGNAATATTATTATTAAMANNLAPARRPPGPARLR
ncbi:MAG: hypothetical protein NTY45_00705, partial [Elusimicrobia bacterium]|nr:hypothetical protein [Elusimicrobiota bacterium]